MKKYIVSMVLIIIVIFIFAFWMANIHKSNNISKNEINNNNLNLATTNVTNSTSNTNINTNTNTTTNTVENTTNSNKSNTSNTSNTSTFNSYEMDSNESEVSPYYERTVGVNGAINYKCTRVCDESCYKCEKCIRNAQGFDRKPKCNFSYKFSRNSKDLGWIGCPQCGDITYDEWNDFYYSDEYFYKSN